MSENSPEDQGKLSRREFISVSVAADGDSTASND